MSKILFTPFSVLAGIVAGFVGKKAFEGLWAAFDDEQAPDPKHRQIKCRSWSPPCCSRARFSARSEVCSITDLVACSGG